MKLPYKIISIGVKEHDDKQLIRRKQLNNLVCLYTLIFASFFVPYLYFIGNYYYMVIEIATVLLISFSFVFNYFGFTNASVFWRFFIIAGDVSYASLEMPGSGFEYFLIPLGFILVILSDSILVHLNLLATAILFFFAILFISQFYHPHSVVSASITRINYIVVLSMVFVVCALFVIRFKLSGLKYEKVIQNQLTEIGEKNKDILDSITYAKRIQNALLPSSERLERSIKESFVFYKQKDIISGDFYWLEQHQGKLLVAVADCTGHGVPGAMMSVLCINSLTKAVNELDETRPCLILDKVNELMEEYFSRNSERVADGMDICLCCIDTGNGMVEFSGAYNSLYIIRNGQLEEIKADKQPIGLLENRKPFRGHTLPLTKGDQYYLFSDGFCDQFGGPDGKKFTYKRFKQVLTDNWDKPMREQGEILANVFNNWKGSLPQVDDVCILGFTV